MLTDEYKFTFHFTYFMWKLYDPWSLNSKTYIEIRETKIFYTKILYLAPGFWFTNSKHELEARQNDSFNEITIK
jgi:hypothetical protein